MKELQFDPQEYGLIKKIDFDWYSSKGTVAAFLVNQLRDHNRSFGPDDAMMLEILLTDLSHGRRRVQDFPQVFPLWIGRAREGMNAKSFTSQVCDQVNNFFAQPGNEERVSLYKEAVGVLNKLSEVCKDDNYDIGFEVQGNNTWVIKSMSLISENNIN